MRIPKRLDRFLANPQCYTLFPSSSVRHGIVAYSDHSPIWLDMQGIKWHRQGPKPFRFEVMWVGMTQCTKIIEQEWSCCAQKGTLEADMRCTTNCGSQLKK